MEYYYVYILANRRHGTLYIGRTTDLKRRIYEHKDHLVKGFTNSHEVTKLMYYETYEDKFAAAEREWKLKKWRRSWKIALIEKDNPGWEDLFYQL